MSKEYCDNLRDKLENSDDPKLAELATLLSDAQLLLLRDTYRKAVAVSK